MKNFSLIDKIILTFFATVMILFVTGGIASAYNYWQKERDIKSHMVITYGGIYKTKVDWGGGGLRPGTSSNGGIYAYYYYYVGSQKYYGFSNKKSVFPRFAQELIGKPTVIVYSSVNPDNSALLLLPSEYAKYNVLMYDSTSWIYRYF